MAPTSPKFQRRSSRMPEPGEEVERVERLRDRVENELRSAGFVWQGHRLVPPDGDQKQVARLLHARQRLDVLNKSAGFIEAWEPLVASYFADGADVDPAAIDPVIKAVVTETEAALFRYASLSWSVPVSQGYGRRTRFLLIDQSNEKLIGIFALGDPVFNLRVRDTLIGWTPAQRQDRLYNVFDAFVLGAVEPYRQLIGGKLAALATVTEETLAVLEAKYQGTKTHIRKQEKPARPVLVTTTSSLGRSSIYNRLAIHGRPVFTSVGFTEGFGHFQFSDALFSELVEFASEIEDLRGSKYGDGPNWKIRTLRTALEQLGLPGDLLRHGLRREVFLAPLGIGWRAFLRGETDTVGWYSYKLAEVAAFFRERWAIPRATRQPAFRSHQAVDGLLTRAMAGLAD
jgi:hypothetical protein